MPVNSNGKEYPTVDTAVGFVLFQGFFGGVRAFMKKRLFSICILGYLVPLLLGTAGKLAGCKMKYILYLIVMGSHLLFWESLCLLTYCHRNNVRSTALVILCYLGMLPFGLYLLLFLMSAVW